MIKVERPGTPDGARNLGETDGADSFYWRIVGRNKRPIELDLKSPAGRELLLRLVRTADVLVENFRPGTLERLGLDPETVLLREQPGLVVLRVTGYGQDGPYARRAGFGTMAEAMSTLAHTTGEVDGPPTLPPIALADEVTGLQGAFAILTALRHRDLTGRGQVIDLSLLESLVDIVGPGPAIYHRTGHVDGRIGSRLPFSAPRNIYRCLDGHVVLSGLGQRGGAACVRRHRPQRVAHRAVHDLPSGSASRRAGRDHRVVDTHAVGRRMRRHLLGGSRCGPVYDVGELVTDPHVKARESFVELDSPAGDGPGAAAPAGAEDVAHPGRDSPQWMAAGACTDQVLAELGYDVETIAKLRSDGVIGAARPLVATGS